MAITAAVAKVQILLLILTVFLAAITVAARPMEGSGGWPENATVRIVTQMLDSGSNPSSHCC